MANSQPFRFGYQDGKYGYIITEGGADTFNPFSRAKVVYLKNIAQVYLNSQNAQKVTIPNLQDHKYLVYFFGSRADGYGIECIRLYDIENGIDTALWGPYYGAAGSITNVDGNDVYFRYWNGAMTYTYIGFLFLLI